MVGIESVWLTIEPNILKRETMLLEMKDFVYRRNQIAHEGDREASRRSGKRLRSINRPYAEKSVVFVKDLIQRIEKAFPG